MNTDPSLLRYQQAATVNIQYSQSRLVDTSAEKDLCTSAVEKKSTSSVVCLWSKQVPPCAAASSSESKPAERPSEVPPLLRSNLSRFGDSYNYADIVHGGSAPEPAPPEESLPKAPLHRERSATADSGFPDPVASETPRARAATVDTIRASRSMNSRAGTSFSVPVKEVFTVVSEEQAYGQLEEGSGYHAEASNGFPGEGFKGFEESASPRGQPFLGQSDSPEKAESADDGRGGVSNILAAIKAGQG